MKTLVIIALICAALFVGYMAGILHATSSDGWMEDDEFVIEVDGHEYTWNL